MQSENVHSESQQSPFQGEKRKTGFTAEQQAFRNSVFKGDNILLIGQAGTGKSYTLTDLNATMTASTGIATSCIENAVTLHRFLGIGVPKEETFTALWSKLLQNPSALRRIRDTHRLVLDEISMVHPRLFVLVDLLFRAARKQFEMPFGGMQVVLVGDFLQLPPVHNTKEDTWPSLMTFQMFSLIGFFPRRFDLTQVFRQGDLRLLAAVQDIREGFVSDQTIHTLEECRGRVFPQDGVEPTVVYTRRLMVHQENERQLQSQPSTGEFKRLRFQAHATMARIASVILRPGEDARKVYLPIAMSIAQQQVTADIARDCLGDIPFDQEIRTDMQVIFVFNVCPHKAKVANGTRGVVCGWVRVPFALGHQTLTPISSDDYQKNARRDPTLAPGDPSAGNLYPVVFIPISGGRMVVQPHSVEVPTERRKAQGSTYMGVLVRVMPFMPGWALTVHRTQGMTIDRLRWQIPHSMMPSAAYVLISRVRSLASLSIDGKLHKQLFWVDRTARQNFGRSAAKVAFGNIWTGPSLDKTHQAAQDYRQWTCQCLKSQIPCKILAKVAALPVPCAANIYDDCGRILFSIGSLGTPAKVVQEIPDGECEPQGKGEINRSKKPRV
jgi:ATP-dependent DNA helicase PIF1